MDTAQPEGEVEKPEEPAEKADSAERSDSEDKPVQEEAQDTANGASELNNAFPTGKMTGRVKSYNTRKGFGFLESPQLPNRDIFVYNTHLVGRIGLIAGEPVDFVLFWDGTRPQARHVKATSQPSVMPASAISGQTFAPNGAPHTAPFQASQPPSTVSGMDNPLGAMKEAMSRMPNMPSAPTQRDLVLAMAANAAEIPTTLPVKKRPGGVAQAAQPSPQVTQDMVAQKIREAQNTASSERRADGGMELSLHAQEFVPGMSMIPPDIGKMAAGRIPKGTSIEVANFPAMEMNGCRGVVLGYDASSSRYNVEVEVRKPNSGQVEKVPLQLKEDWLRVQGKMPQPKSMSAAPSVPRADPAPGGQSAAQRAAQAALAQFLQKDAPPPAEAKATTDAPRNMDATMKAALQAQNAMMNMAGKSAQPPKQRMQSPEGPRLNSGMPFQPPPMPSAASKAPEAKAPMPPSAFKAGYPERDPAMPPPPAMPNQQAYDRPGMPGHMRPPPPMPQMPPQPGMPPQPPMPSMMSKQTPPVPLQQVSKAPMAEPTQAASQPRGMQSADTRPAQVAKPVAATPSVPEQQKATKDEKDDGLPGWPGARWRVLRTREFNDVIVREACEVTSKELRRINPDEVCTQKGDCVRLDNGVLRMPIHPMGWATVNAKEIGGPVFLELLKDQPPAFTGKAFSKSASRPLGPGPPQPMETPSLLPSDTGGPTYARATLLSIRMKFLDDKAEEMAGLRTLRIPGMAGPPESKRERRRDREDRKDKEEKGEEDRPRRRDLAKAAVQEKPGPDQLQEWDPWGAAAEARHGHASPPKSRNHETPKKQRGSEGEHAEKQGEKGEKGEKQGQCPTQ